MRIKPEQLIQFLEGWGMKKEAEILFEREYKHRLGEKPPESIDDWIRNRRNVEAFQRDILLSWFVENVFRLWLERKLKANNPDIQVTKFGSNADRRIIPGKAPKGVTTIPDYEIHLPDGRIKRVEFHFATAKLRAYDIKEDDPKRMEEYNGIILFAILPERKFFILKDPNWILDNFELRPNPRWGGKPCYNMPASKLNWYDADEPLPLEAIF